jgi:heat shock protein HtpX
MNSKRFPVDYQLKARMFLTLFLLAALYLFFGAVLWYVGVGTSAIIIIVGIMLFCQYYFSDKLVLMSTGAREVSPLKAPELHSIVERLAMLADMPKPKVAVMPSSIPNAFATGRNPRNAVVAVTNGLLQQLTPQEVDAVLAHEISHVKNRDVAIMTIASFFATVASFIVQNFFFIGGGFGGDREDRGGTMIIYLVSLLVWLISFFLIRALSRYREYSADRGAAFLTGSPGMLSNALLKISGSMQRVPERDLRQAEAMNAFFILPALRGSFSELLSTHPSLEKRLAYLRELEREMRG